MKSLQTLFDTGNLERDQTLKAFYDQRHATKSRLFKKDLIKAFFDTDKNASFVKERCPGVLDLTGTLRHSLFDIASAEDIYCYLMYKTSMLSDRMHNINPKCLKDTAELVIVSEGVISFLEIIVDLSETDFDFETGRARSSLQEIVYRTVQMAEYLNKEVYPNLWTSNENIRFPSLYHLKMTGVFLEHRNFYENLVSPGFYAHLFEKYREACEYAVSLMIDRPEQFLLPECEDIFESLSFFW